MWLPRGALHVESQRHIEVDGPLDHAWIKNTLAATLASVLRHVAMQGQENAHAAFLHEGMVPKAYSLRLRLRVPQLRSEFGQ